MKLKETVTAYELGTIEALNHALDKHGMQSDISIDRQYVILAEEFMELTMAICNEDWTNAVEELHQVAAMSVKLLKLLMEVDQ